MASSNSIVDLNSSKALAIDHIAHHLVDGQLCLFLGAGVSADAGLPGWSKLVAGMASAANVNPARLRKDRLKAVDDILEVSKLTQEDLPDLIRSALYSPYMRSRRRYTKSATRALVPTSIVELVAGSARGSVSEIFTLNFDDLIETQLADRGFVCQSVPNFPRLLEGTVDARLFHLHGYVPLSPDGPGQVGDLVISYEQYRSRLANTHPWHQLIESTLLSKAALFVGVSFDDLEMDSIFLRCFETVDKTRPIGFAVMRRAHQGLRTQLANAGVVSVNVDSYSEIPELIREITRSASALLLQRRGNMP